MRIVNEQHEDEILKELSIRFKQYRIDANITQREVAERAKVSLRTISRFEKGEDISLRIIVRLFKAIGVAKNLEVILPDRSLRPSSFFEDYHPKQRAIAQKKAASPNKKWKWGDEK